MPLPPLLLLLQLLVLGARGGVESLPQQDKQDAWEAAWKALDGLLSLGRSVGYRCCSLLLLCRRISRVGSEGHTVPLSLSSASETARFPTNQAFIDFRNQFLASRFLAPLAALLLTKLAEQLANPCMAITPDPIDIEKPWDALKVEEQRQIEAEPYKWLGTQWVNSLEGQTLRHVAESKDQNLENDLLFACSLGAVDISQVAKIPCDLWPDDPPRLRSL